MLCDMCGEKEACVHLTQMVNDEVKKLQLCESCAVASGLDVNSPESFPEILLGIGGRREAGAPAPDKTCPACQMHLSDFKKTLRLGCRHCYNEFEVELGPLIEGMQKKKQHVGKVPARYAGKLAEPRRPADLERALKAAIATENYEQAAVIRDRIRKRAQKGGRKDKGGKR